MTRMNRRSFLCASASLAALAASGGRPRRAAAGGDCVLYPSQTEGPFFFDTGLLRSDISEGRPGLPLQLSLRFVASDGCTPVPNAVVQIWHTDAAGLYSGYVGQGDDGSIDTRGQTFMRGLQVTDGEGRVVVDTIYPGWYPGRVAHVHFKVFLDDSTVATSQLYFPDEVGEAVYETAPYSARGQSPTSLATDVLLRNTSLESVLLDVGGDPGEALQAERSVGIALPPGFTPAATATAPGPTATPLPPTEDCAGDCSGDGTVSIDELVRGVNMALGNAPLDDCDRFDRDGNRLVSVAELVAAVNSALRGCA
jgi:protocatechuate 3,4-dioxygenase beta subunit